MRNTPAIPPAAREAIEAFGSLDLDPALRAALDRLAGPDLQEVWQRVSPAEAGVLVTGALMAYAAALGVAVPASFGNEMAELAECARRLADALAQPDLGYESPVPVSGFIALLRDFERYCRSIDEDARRWVGRMPRMPRERNTDAAPHIYFGRLMAEWMIRLTGKPRYRVVAALITALFDPPEPVTTDQVRDWRRKKPI
jgi:hypothetical protein